MPAIQKLLAVQAPLRLDMETVYDSLTQHPFNNLPVIFIKQQRKRVHGMLQYNTTCSDCFLKSRCFPQGLNGQELLDFQALLPAPLSLKNRTNLNDACCLEEHILVIKSGYVKITDPNHHVIDFYGPGCFLGDLTLREQSQPPPNIMTALSRLVVCRISKKSLNEKIDQYPSIRAFAMRLLSRKIHRADIMHVIFMKENAETKLAYFLLWMSECLKKNNLPHHIFILPMMKKDIASFIGISPETTARMIRQLEAIDVIANQGRTLVIKQPEYLFSLLPPGLIGHLT